MAMVQFQDQPAAVFTAIDQGVRLHVKVVPGSSRTKVSGVLGGRLKVLVAAAPQAGKANQAVCKLLAKTFGVSRRDVVITSGHTQALKTVEIAGLDLGQGVQRLNEQIG